PLAGNARPTSLGALGHALRDLARRGLDREIGRAERSAAQNGKHSQRQQRESPHCLSASCTTSIHAPSSSWLDQSDFSRIGTLSELHVRVAPFFLKLNGMAYTY